VKSGNSLTANWVDNGLILYAEYNKDRKTLEEQAANYMKYGFAYPRDKEYLKTDFLRWMRSRNSRIKFEYAIDSSSKQLEIINQAKGKNDLNIDFLEKSLERLSEISGVGPVLASAILTLSNPTIYGIVCQYTVIALKREVHHEYHLNNTHDVRDIIFEMANIRNYFKEKYSKEYRVRDIDMALWAYGKRDEKKRCVS